jgi:hypothetical protein
LRYFPASEIGVSAFITRDTDSRINPREAAAVQQFMDHPTAQYHLMHECMHDDRYGEIMGGMWGCKVIKQLEGNDNSVLVPCPGLLEAAEKFLHEERGGLYGDDMKFLAQFLSPLISEQNCLHHIDGDMNRKLGNLNNKQCRLPFPTSNYKGFVGQPVRCKCEHDKFLQTGCVHVNTALPQGIAQLLGSNSNALGSIGSFLG